MVSLFLFSKTEKTTRIRQTLISISTNLILFILFFCFYKPIYDTGEDVYILYKLSGGFGGTPSELVHYNYGLHPFLGWIVSLLFNITKDFNWYTLILILGHFISCTFIFSRLLMVHPFKWCFPLFLLMFVVFECKFLATINFTNTAIILGCAAVVALHDSNNRRILHSSSLWGILFLLFASFFRIHVLIPLVGVSVPFLLLTSKKTALANAIILTGAGLLILVFNLIHQHYYEKRIPGWQQEEAYRQTLYQFYNHKGLYKPNAGERWYSEMGWINRGLPIDTSFLNTGMLNTMFADLKAKNQPKLQSNEEWRWFWINNRILFFTILIVIVSSGFRKELVLTEVFSLVLLISGLLFLRLMGKFPDYLLPGCLLSLSLLIVVSANFSTREYQVAGRNIIMAMVILWGIIQLYKLNQKHDLAIASFRTAAATVMNKPDTLFVACADFPLQKFHVFDLPEKYPLTNFLCNEHFLHNDYHVAFERFGIESVNSLYGNDRVVFLGCDSTLMGYIPF